MEKLDPISLNQAFGQFAEVVFHNFMHILSASICAANS